MIGENDVHVAVGIAPLQLPVAPIPPPDPEFEAYGKMEWDLPAAMDYAPYREITAVVEAWNPSDIDRLYGMEYYFVNPDGAIAGHGYLAFVANGMQFYSFILHAGAIEPMVTSVVFKAPATGYRFGLRLLELEMVDSMATIKRETSRLEVLLGVRGNGMAVFTPVLAGLVTIAMLGVMVTGILKGGGQND